MQPQQPQDNQNGRPLNIPSRNDSAGSTLPHRQAAANIMRDRINQIYDTNPPNQPQATSDDTAESPYQRTHDPAKSAATWQQYHSAWQNYYRQYYQRYYMSQLEAHRKSVEAEQAKKEARRNFESTGTPQTIIGNSAAAQRRRRFSRLIGNSGSDEEQTEMPVVPNREIRNELLAAIQSRAKKLRQSHHFMPIMSAVIVGVLFLGLQYNRIAVAQVMAYVSPGNARSENIIIDPTTDLKVGPEPRLIIPKINVDVPIVYGVESLENNIVQNALRDGVVHYPIPGAHSMPGQAGNNVILGHSSNDVFDAGAYKFAFVLLDRLEKGDTFYIHHDSIRYTYTVTEKRVINPDQIDALILNTDKPMTSLVTCTPVGTALQRLIVYAEQISPDPTKASEKPTDDAIEQPANLPGNSPTLLERLFGA